MNFMCVRFILLLFSIMGCLWGNYPPLPEPQTEEEALFVRRILDFWKDKEYPFAKSQIKSYLKNYPHSECSDHFWAMLGDMAMKSQDYEQALDYYNRIHNPEISVEVNLKKWQALYQLELYTQLYQEITPSLAALNQEESYFYFAEAAFREALALFKFEEGKKEAKSLCEEALPFYEHLLENSLFSSHAKLAMAEIYRLLKKPEKAAELYLDLAEHDENSEILFHAASVLLSCDKQRASELFEKLAKEKGSVASEAAFQWLQLLADQERWDTISHERTLFTKQLGESHLPICYFYLGMINMQKKLYHQAIADLKKCVGKSLAPQHEKRAYLNLLVSARELDNLDLCQTCFEMITRSFPEAKPEALFLLASAHHKMDQKGEALQLYSQLATSFAESEFAEKATIEKIRVLVEQKEFSFAHKELLHFLEHYPKSNKKTELIRLAIDISLTQIAEEKVYAQLVEDLERAFNAHVFHPYEMPKQQRVLAGAYLKLNQAEKALTLLNSMENPDLLLLTQGYILKESEPEKIIAYGEKALKVYPDENKLHLHLFNAYLEVAKEHDKEHCTQKAAEHLDRVVDAFPISLENRLWLAHYYSNKDPHKAIPILASLVQTETNLKRFDNEALLLAKHYRETGNLKEAHSLLETLITIDQKSALEAKLLLAHVLLDQGEEDRARALYLKLEDNAELSIAYAAKLALARLDFSKTPEKNLKKLHDLAVHKTLANEPIHLEAALDYSELKASMSPQDEQRSTLLKLLVEVKEAFTKQEDIWSKDYHAARELLPEKELVYQAYMRYLDARIFNLEAQIAKESGDFSEGKVKENAARALFSTLRQGKYSVSSYIKQRSTIGYEQ